MKQSIERSYIGPRQVRSLAISASDVTLDNALALSDIGIGLSLSHLEKMEAWGMDAAQPLITSGNLGAPVQFLQTFLPGLVRILTSARKIDELIGVTTSGSWEDEEVVQGIVEPLGESELYGDYTNIPVSSYNTEYVRRTVVRFENGIKVGTLEEARMGRANINTAAEKRAAAAMSLDIIRNRVGFFGYNGGANRTFGFLNAPSLPAYVTAANGAGGSSLWSNKTFLEITADLRGMVGRLQTASGDTIDPSSTPITLVVSTNVYQFLTITNAQGYGSVLGWLKETYPKIRITSAPELNGANGGANVAYLYAESVSDSGTDDGRVWTQIVPTRFQTLGVERQAKAYVEDYTNATAGVMLKRPYAVQRLTGI
jgi:hypothetical protein